MVRAYATTGHGPVDAARSFSCLSFVILLSAGFWAGALWLTRLMVLAATGG